jgi:hypothetical protein
LEDLRQHSFWYCHSGKSFRKRAADTSAPTAMASPHYNNKLIRQHSSCCFYTWQPWLIFCWICHFMLSILVIFWGGIHNHDSKYIPVNVEVLMDENPNNNCSKGFVNVFASSMDDPGALVCCSNDVNGNVGTLEDGICDPPHWLFFISRRLARFPEAWLLPLFPLFVRLIVQTLQKHSSPSVSVSSSSSNNNNSQHRLARRRFYLYVGIIQFRGWILYLLFDTLEGWLVASAGRGCWYESLLHENYSSCQGRGSDFSDHVVLYFAQILPVALVEVLHSFVEPYWNTRTTSDCTTTSLVRIPQPVPTILIAGMVYLYTVTFMGAYKTAVYFHTWPEIMNGYLVSLLVQIPLCLMQCTTLLEPIREYFFGYAS